MEINTVEVQIQKINTYLESVLKEDKKLYKKTKLKLKDIGVKMSESLVLISKILEEQALRDTEEFQNNDSALEEAAKVLYSESTQTVDAMKGLQQFINNSSDSAKLTSTKRKYIISQYGKILKEVSISDIKYPIVAECAKLLWIWFDTRFFQSPKLHKDFRYNIKQIPIWIQSIVITYGYTIQTGTNEQFASSFQAWCENLMEPSAREPYALPYYIHNMYNDLHPEMISFASLGIWDILFDAGMSALADPELDGVALSEYSLQDRFQKVDSEVVDAYTYCNGNEDLLKQYKLIGGER